jgi:hypothetical protein
VGVVERHAVDRVEAHERLQGGQADEVLGGGIGRILGSASSTSD